MREEPAFLSVKLGDYVLVDAAAKADVSSCASDWWIGLVIHIVNGARKVSCNSYFQVINVDTGVVNLINADRVEYIL